MIVRSASIIKRIISLLVCTVLILGAAGNDGQSFLGLTAEASPVNTLQYNYYYSLLSNDEKSVYQDIYKTLQSGKDNCTVSCTMDTDSVMEITSMFFYDTPEFFNLKEYQVTTYTASGGKYKYEFKFTYYYTKTEYDKMMKQLNAEAQKILNKITDKMTVYDKIQHFHDEIIKSCSYDINSKDSNNIYGVLVDKKAKCDGYSRTMSYLCMLTGIKCIFITGDASDGETYGGHAWNKVYYNKTWHNVDATFDDLNLNGKDDVSYKYFMVSDKTIGATHIQDKTTNSGFEYPAADDDSQGYFHKNKLYIDNADEFNSIVTEEIIETAGSKGGKVSFKVSSKNLLDKVKNPDIIYPILKKANKSSENKFVTNEWEYSVTESTLTFTIFLKYNN